MYYKTKFIAVLIALSLVLVGCGPGMEAIITDDSGATPSGIQSVVNSNNQFTFDLYSKLSQESGNLFISPLSISSALSMAHEGARGETAEQMASTFHLTQDKQTIRSSFAALHNMLHKKDSPYVLNSANALWIDQTHPLLNDYATTIKTYYAGEINAVDFVNDQSGAIKTMNEWVEKNTNNKIRGFFTPGTIDPEKALVLANAVYFKGDWTKQFEKKNTEQSPFTTDSGTQVQVPMMSQTGKDAKFNYAETDELQVLEMPYEGNDLSMLVLLPKDNLNSLEHSITADKLSEWRSQLEEQRVDIFIPRFTFTKKYKLTEHLKQLGMPLAFSEDNADFSGIDGLFALPGEDRLFIDQVIHQAFIDVNEEGTEAAAATGGVFGSIAPTNVPVFKADHPFIFIIQERQTGGILFLGRVTNPLS